MSKAHNLALIGSDTWSNGHLRFDPMGPRSGKPSWDIVMHATNSLPVGYLRWNSVWREYVLLTREGYIFAEDCLTDIATLLRILNAG